MSTVKLKILIIGHARHGKDTLAEYLSQQYKLKIFGSKQIAAEIMFPIFKTKYNYKTIQDCFLDRVNHRIEWFNEIEKFNKLNAASLISKCVDVADVYVGLRSLREFKAGKSKFNLILWVDASKRLPLEPTMQLTPDMADVIIDNNSTLDNFLKNIKTLQLQ